MPDGFDCDMWLGPAPRAPFHRQRTHYQFRYNMASWRLGGPAPANPQPWRRMVLAGRNHGRRGRRPSSGMSPCRTTSVLRRWAVADSVADVRTVIVAMLAVPLGAAGAALSVGEGEKFSRIEAALEAAQPGDTIEVHPLPGGRPYEKVALLVRKPRIAIRAAGAEGRKVVLDGKGYDYSGRGSVPRAIVQFHEGGDGSSIEGFELRGAHNESHNGAGVRINQANDVTVRNCTIHSNDMGIMSNGNGTPGSATGQLIENCLIHSNGDHSHPGYNHNLYLGGTEATMRGCEVHSSLTGHNFKSRAHRNIVIGCYIHDSANREFDLVDGKGDTDRPGSDAILIGNVIVKDPNCRSWGRCLVGGVPGCRSWLRGSATTGLGKPSRRSWIVGCRCRRNCWMRSAGGCLSISRARAAAGASMMGSRTWGPSNSSRGGVDLARQEWRENKAPNRQPQGGAIGFGHLPPAVSAALRFRCAAVLLSPAAGPVRSGEGVERPSEVPELAGWPLDAGAAGELQRVCGETTRTLELGGGVTLDLVRIPAGRFVMGDPQGHPDEWPPSVVEIAEPFWIGRCEVTNEQYRLFDPAHDSRFEHKGSWVFSEHHLGWPLNQPRQPVVRISWDEARAFCEWLSGRVGLRVDLPTEAQWEWACRAGMATPLGHGGLDDDFSSFANLADATIRELAYDTDGRFTADIVPRDDRFDDGVLVTAAVGSFRPNHWGLHDMHGNAWEWTRSCYRPYPYRPGDGRNDPQAAGPRVVRGGSWYDRPKRSRSGYRLPYEAWQKVFNVGFRVVVGIPDEAAVRRMAEPRIEFPLAIDTKARMKKKLAVMGIPHAILIEPGGFVVWEGFPLLEGHELTAEKLAAYVKVGRGGEPATGTKE